VVIHFSHQQIVFTRLARPGKVTYFRQIELFQVFSYTIFLNKSWGRLRCTRAGGACAVGEIYMFCKKLVFDFLLWKCSFPQTVSGDTFPFLCGTGLHSAIFWHWRQLIVSKHFLTTVVSITWELARLCQPFYMLVIFQKKMIHILTSLLFVPRINEQNIKSFRFAACFRGISRLGPDFMTLWRFRFAHICFASTITSLHKGDEVESMSKHFY